MTGYACLVWIEYACLVYLPGEPCPDCRREEVDE